MSATVVIPNHLARHFKTSKIDIEASNLKGALETVSRDYHLDGILLNAEGHLQPFIRIVVDNDLITSRGASDLGQVSVAGKTIHIMTAFAGG
jgi:hypothetical protein